MLSVVVSCLESETYLQATLKSIYDTTLPPNNFEVLVIRRENAPYLIDAKRFPVREYRGSFGGQAEALNYGIARTKGDIVCVTRPGCLVSPDWLEIIERFFKLYPSTDGLGGPVLPCSEVGTRIQKLASQVFYEGQFFPKSVVILQIGSFAGLFHATNAAFRKTVLESVAFDESYVYDYDFDACWRMLRKGYRLVFYPKMKIRRIFQANLREILAMYYRWGIESTVLKRRYNLELGLKGYIFPFYNTLRSFLEPKLLGSTSALEKSFLTLVQHIAYYTGVMRAYSIQKYTIQT
jgi:cellulose synthase/poly-beta-1,6-N-acetylglucosamine synthase-like glycosyltransferase